MEKFSVIIALTILCIAGVTAQTCVCVVGVGEAAPLTGIEVQSFDFEDSGFPEGIDEAGKEVLVEWNPSDIGDNNPCKFKLIGKVSEKNGNLRLKNLNFQFGQHPKKASKYSRKLKIGGKTAKEKGKDENGVKFKNVLDLSAGPYEFDNGDTQLTLSQSGKNFTVASTTCSWGFEFVKNVPKPYNVLTFTVETGGDGQPQPGDLDGACGNCDGVFDDYDYVGDDE